MKRLAILTIGKTHSGKSTFAKLLNSYLPNSIVIDQDHHAAFLNTYYSSLIPQTGVNTLKIGLSQFILQYAVKNSLNDIILCNSNLIKSHRESLIDHFFPQNEFIRIFVYFHLSDDILYERIRVSTRNTNIFRKESMTFERVLLRQGHLEPPTEDEVDFIFHINESTDQISVIESIQKLKR